MYLEEGYYPCIQRVMLGNAVVGAVHDRGVQAYRYKSNIARDMYIVHARSADVSSTMTLKGLNSWERC